MYFIKVWLFLKVDRWFKVFEYFVYVCIFIDFSFVENLGWYIVILDFLYSYNFVDIYVGCLDIMNNIDKDIFLN